MLAIGVHREHMGEPGFGGLAHTEEHGGSFSLIRALFDHSKPGMEGAQIPK